MFTKLQCYNVGVAAYSTNWYLMDLDIQKDINMIILRAQNPPRLTAGRAMDLNVNTFMNVSHFALLKLQRLFGLS